MDSRVSSKKTTTCQLSGNDSNSKSILTRQAQVPLKKQKYSQQYWKDHQRQWLLANPLGTQFLSPGVIQPTAARVNAVPNRNSSSASAVHAFGPPKSRVESITRPSLPTVKPLSLSKATVADRTASHPPSSGACPLINLLPQEVHDIILSYLFDGAMVLDKGWHFQDYEATDGMNPRNLPVLWRVSKPAFPGQSTARITPVSSRANTSIMFTCKKLYEAYAPQVYKRSAFAISQLQSPKTWLLPKHGGSSKLRNRRSSWITTLHIHIPAYGAPRFRSDIQHQAQYYLSWRNTMDSLAEVCTNLKEVHLSVDVPQKLPLRVDLRQDWAWCLLPLASCKSLNTCTVELNMDWHSDMIGAFEEYLTIILKGGDRADAVAALESARTQAFCTEEGMHLIDEWDEIVMWNERERNLVETAAEWGLMLPAKFRSLPTPPPSDHPWETIFDHLQARKRT